MKMQMRVFSQIGDRIIARITASTGPGVIQALFFEWTVDAYVDPATRSVAFARPRWTKKGDTDTSMFSMTGVFDPELQTMSGRVRLKDCGAFSLARSTHERLPQSRFVPPPRPDAGRTIARFGDFAKWKYTGGDADGHVALLANGDARLHLAVTASSGAFKYFAEPHAVLVVTDIEGNPIAQIAQSGLTMRMGTRGLDSRTERRLHTIKAPDFEKATYAFFGFKFCGWQQTFERTRGDSNGCAQSDMRRDYDAFVRDLAQALSSTTAKPGEPFSILGWRGMRMSK